MTVWSLFTFDKERTSKERGVFEKLSLSLQKMGHNIVTASVYIIIILKHQRKAQCLLFSLENMLSD